MPSEASTQAVHSARARSVAYNVVAELLLSPNDSTEAELTSGRLRQDLSEAVDDLGVDASALLERLATTPNTTKRALEREQMRVFGPTIGQDHAPYSTEYDPNGKFRKEHELADIAGYYKAWGLAIDENLHERFDHFGIEADYLAFLSLKEAYALIEGEPERAAEVRSTADRFAKRYIAAAAREFADRLERTDENGLFTAVAGFLVEMLRAQGVPARGQPRIGSLPVVQ